MLLIFVPKASKMKAKEKKTPQNSNVKELNPWPQYIEDRLSLWEKFKAKYSEELQQKPKTPIKVTLPDGKIVEGVSWETTAYDIAKNIR